MSAIGLVGFLHIVTQCRQAKQIQEPVFLQATSLLSANPNRATQFHCSWHLGLKLEKTPSVKGLLYKNCCI